jgi:tetratricopeptide (TPR) repeat protein
MIYQAGQDRFRHSLTLIKSGQYQEASEILAGVCKEEESNHKAWNAFGVALAKLGEGESARTCFSNALLFDPDNPTYKRNRDKLAPKGISPGALAGENAELPVSKTIKKKKTYDYTLIAGILLLVLGIILIIAGQVAGR